MRKYNLSRLVWNEMSDEQVKHFKTWLDNRGENIGVTSKYVIGYDMILYGFDYLEYLTIEIKEAIRNGQFDNDELTSANIHAYLPEYDQLLIDNLRIKECYEDLVDEILEDLVE